MQAGVVEEVRSVQIGDRAAGGAVQGDQPAHLQKRPPSNEPKGSVSKRTDPHAGCLHSAA
ncbi:hypothetical protein GCM10010303_75630 [Streptomyces purpurascens]|nr:hypothetical protein GCM10010303_75630 [Streptomyces purpurascens]